MRNTELIDFTVKGDQRGSLVAIENFKDIPFEIKRVYYVFGTKLNLKRGKHAHSKLQQVLICVSGTCKIELDDGKEKIITNLNKPSLGLYIGSLIWREIFDFSPECVLLVLASDIYDEDEYIRDYSRFKKLVD
ncbi:MAG: FdtA/QdtA family cupin domain-containing protein [Candidatus Caenarcaniphilales bacterium]|nr:FdtA/QdtA family cupin domain-containing protein [Candidatus Caenarcaniphilales bacterium]